VHSSHSNSSSNTQHLATVKVGIFVIVVAS